MTDLKTMAKGLDAFEADPWTIPAVLDGELMTDLVIDPCCGTGLLAAEAETRGHDVLTFDVHDWSQHFDCRPPGRILNFLQDDVDLPAGRKFTVLVNPPFPTATKFVDRAMELGARKVICFQRWSWRGSKGRRKWWGNNPPARIWLCTERATCWRFDIPKSCIAPGTRPNKPGKKRHPDFACRKCMAGTPTDHAWFVWEQGHPGNQVICELMRPA
jgi:hypothetical protein